MRRLTTLLLVLGVIAGCSPGEATDTTTTSAPTASTGTTLAPASTTIPTPTTTTSEALPADATVIVLLAPYSEMGPEWAETMFPYGEDEQHLGTSIGGEGLMWGPEYGAQLADGSWWFFDAASLRLAHFDGDATYLGQVPMPTDLLVAGTYFQYQMPIALDNDWVTGFGFRGENETSILRLADDALTAIDIESTLAWALTDGSHLYGLSFDDGLLYQLDPDTGAVEEVDALFARDGSRFRVTLDNSANEVRIELPDIGITRTLQMRYSEDPEVRAFASLEFETGVDGSLHLLFSGVPETDESLGIGGYMTIGPDGSVSEVSPIRDLFTPADPGTGSRLGITPGTSTPWIMVIGEEAVHVYTRQG